jgi:hypothetical protein
MPDIADVAWSERDDHNTEAVPNGWPTGAFPAYTDLVGQMMMGATKRFWNKINPVYQTTGTGDNYIVQTEVGIDQINLYEILCLRIDRSNTGTTPTLQFGATNSRVIVKAGASGYVSLDPGDMYAGNSHTFWYNGAFYILVDPAIIIGETVQPYSANLTSWAAVARATGFDTFVATPNSANLGALVGDETGTGALVFGTGPTVALSAASTAVTQTLGDNSTKLATTAFVQSAITATTTLPASKYATTTALPAVTYANGSSGVGATLTANANGALSVDGTAVSVNDVVLVKNQASTFQNGIYTVAATGSAGAPFVLTRATYYDQSSEINLGDNTFISSGVTLASTTWQQNGTEQPVIGTNPITFVQVAGVGTYTAGNGLSLTGTQFALSSPVSIANGGTNAGDVGTARLNFTVPVYVTSIAALQALDTTKDTVVELILGNRSGRFNWTSGNYSSLVTADTTNAVYIKANAIASTSGAWVRVNSSILNVFWFGAVGDGSTDDQPAFAAAYALAKVQGSATTEGPCGEVWGPPGYRYKFGSSLALDVPVRLKVESEILYTPTTGAAVIVGSTLHTSRGNTQYDIDLSVLRAVNGNSVAPTGINTSGSIGLEIRDMQFSRVRVEFTIAFTYAGIYANASNNVFTGQHIQDNWIWHGEAGYCGVGFLAESHGAADGAFQVNEVHIQNSFSNWNNIVLGKSGDANTNNNMFFVAAADADTGGGNTILWSSYNFMQFGYVSGSITLQASTFYNKIYHQVGTAQCTVTDSGTGNLVQNNVEGTLSLERWRTTGTTALQRLESTDAGATVADMLEFYRNSASPANNDAAAAQIWSINDDAAAKRTVARLYVDIPTVAAANLNSRFRWETTVGNTQANRMTLWQGLILGAPTNGDLGAATINIPSTADYYIDASPLNPTVVTKTGDFTVGLTENNVVCNKGSTLTVTLPSAATFPKRKIRLKTIQAFTVVSASSNVVPLTSATAGTAILAATAGKWADLQSDGTNWIVMAGN